MSNKAQYMLSRMNKHTVKVVKFQDGEEAPASTYHVVDSSEGRQQCDCPAFINRSHKPCKHMGYVAEFKTAGEPQPFQIER